MDASIADEAENLIHRMAAEMTAPRARECLPCYLDRMLHDMPCDGSQRLSTRYRDAVAPRATALPRKLAQAGGCCDCEVLYNVYWSQSDTVRPCTGVRRGSTQPCTLWTRHSRGDPRW